MQQQIEYIKDIDSFAIKVVRDASMPRSHRGDLDFLVITAETIQQSSQIPDE